MNQSVPKRTSLAADAMPSRFTAHIVASEWRWVTSASFILTMLVLVPLLWVALRGTPGWQFMGILHNYQDGATYLSKMQLGGLGEWLVYFQHTPETHDGAIVQLLYNLLGHLSRLSGVPQIVMFHVARVIAALMMYAALYYLGASIWVRVRSRRIFFLIVALGSGFGWFFGPLLQVSNIPDLTLPEAFPLYTTFVNVHFPLTIACLALLAGLFITLFRPSIVDDPTFDSGWWSVSLLSLFLAFLYPQSLVPIGGAVMLYAVSLYLQNRRLEMRIVRWVLALILPAVPVAAYYYFVVTFNPAMAEWNRQNVNLSPPIWAFVLGLGLPLLIGLPSIFRALRRFERDGDRLMILWLIAMLIACYIPMNVQRRFAVGMMIPVAYFATRAIEDVWLPKISRRLRPIVYTVFLSLIAVTNVLVLFLPVTPALVGLPQAATGVFLERDYALTYRYLEPRTLVEDVVLAAPVPSVWIPAWAGARVVYGHPYETLNAEQKEAQVREWYAIEDASDPRCAALIEQYNVRYILVGPQEAYLGSAACAQNLRQMIQIGAVGVYAP